MTPRRVAAAEFGVAVVFALAVMVSTGPLLGIPLPALGWKRIVPADLVFVVMVAAWGWSLVKGPPAATTRGLGLDAALLVAAVGLCVAVSPEPARGVPDLARLAYSLAVCLFFARLDLSGSRATRFAAWYVAGAAAIGVGTLVAYAAGRAGIVTAFVSAESGPGWQGALALRTLGPFPHPTTLAVFLTSALFFAAVLGVGARARRTRLLAAAAAIVFVAGTMLTASRALGGMLVGALVWSVLTRPWTPWHAARTTLLAVVTAALVALTAASLVWNILPVSARYDPETRFATVRAYLAPELRALLYRGALQLTAAHPVFGVGPGRFGEEVKATLSYQEVADASRYYVRAPDGGAAELFRTDPDPHSSVFGWLARTGLVGFGAFVWFFARRFAALYRARAAAGPTALAAMGCLAAFVYDGFAVEIVHLRFVWIVVGVALAMTRPVAVAPAASAV